MTIVPSSEAVPAAPGKAGGSQAGGSAPHQPHVLCSVCVHHTFPGLPPHCLLLLCAGIPAAPGEATAFFPWEQVTHRLWSAPGTAPRLWDLWHLGTALHKDRPQRQQLLALSLNKYFSSWQLLTQKKYLASSLQNYLFLYF